MWSIIPRRACACAVHTLCTQLGCTFPCRAVLLLGVSNARRADDCCSCINWYFFLAVCPLLACLPAKLAPYVTFPAHSAQSACLPGQSCPCVVCKVRHRHLPKSKLEAISLAGNLTSADKMKSTLSLAMATPPAPCQSQIGHFANRQLTNWAADVAARPDLFEIEARSPRRVMVVQGGVEHGGELHKLNHFIITVFSQGSSRFLGKLGLPM